jgi:hypothetical protein
MRQSGVFATQLRQLRDGEVEIRIERKRATRNQQQNRLYWGVVLWALSEHTGYTPDELHEICKAKFLPKQLAVADGNGEVVGEFVIGGSTTKLSMGEFSDYLRQIKLWAAELGVVIPESSEGWA